NRPAAGDGAGVFFPRRHQMASAGEAGDHHRSKACDRRPVAQLPLVVVTPAADGPAGQEGAGVAAARGNGLHTTAEADDVHRCQAPRHGAVTELAVLIVTPALHATRRRQRAGVPAARGDRLDTTRQPADVHRRETVGVRPIPELAETVLAPAPDTAGAGEGAGVQAS